MCMQLVENLRLERDVVIQDCDALMKQGIQFPDWLQGSPTLIQRSTYTRYVGSEAVVQLSGITPTAPPQRSASRPAPPVAAPAAPRGHPPAAPPMRHGTEPVSARMSSLQEEPEFDDVFDSEPMPSRHDDDPFGFGDIVDQSRIEEMSSKSSSRVTEDDVNRYMAERKRMDERRAQQQGQMSQ